MNGAGVLLDGFIVLLGVVLIAVGSIIALTFRNGVPPMPSSGRVRARLVQLVGDLSLPRDSIVMELGSGWGGLAVELCRLYPAGTVVGYENSPVPFLFSRAARRLLHAPSLRLERADFNTISLREADLVVCYLSPAAMGRLQPKFEAELKPTAVIVSSTFALPVWKPSYVIAADDIYRTRIYVYRAGSRFPGETGRHIDILTPGSDIE